MVSEDIFYSLALTAAISAGGAIFGLMRTSERRHGKTEGKSSNMLLIVENLSKDQEAVKSRVTKHYEENQIRFRELDKELSVVKGSTALMSQTLSEIREDYRELKTMIKDDQREIKDMIKDLQSRTRRYNERDSNIER